MRLAGSVLTWKPYSNSWCATQGLSKLLPSPVACGVCWSTQKGLHPPLVSRACGLFRAHIHALTNPSMIDLALVWNCVYPSDFDLAKLASRHLQTPGIGPPLSPSWSAIRGFEMPVLVRLNHPLRWGTHSLPLKDRGASGNNGARIQPQTTTVLPAVPFDSSRVMT